MFRSVSMLHSQVVAKMRHQEALKAGVGGVFYTTKVEFIERGRPTNEGIFALNQDVKKNLVYEDPKSLRDRLDQLDANETKYKDTSWWPPSDEYFAIKKQLEDLTGEMEARATRAGPEGTKAQLSFSSAFFGFKGRWDEFYSSIHTSALEDQGGNTLLDAIDTYDAEYRRFIDQYIALGFKPTFVPEKSKVGDTFGDVPKFAANLSASIPWDKIALFGVGAAALYWFVNRRPSPPEPVPPPSPRIGPPEVTTEAQALTRAHGG